MAKERLLLEKKVKKKQAEADKQVGMAAWPCGRCKRACRGILWSFLGWGESLQYCVSASTLLIHAPAACFPEHSTPASSRRVSRLRGSGSE